MRFACWRRTRDVPHACGGGRVSQQAERVLCVVLPQSGWPRVETVKGSLESWYGLVGSPIQVVGLSVALSSGQQGVLIVDEEGRCKRKVPNPWAMLLGRLDVVGDAVLVARRGGEFESVDEACARSLVTLFTRQYAPSFHILEWPEGGDPQ